MKKLLNDGRLVKMDGNGELQGCARCGNLFFYSGIGKCICAACKEEDELEFNTVKDYISEHLSATILEVSRETGVRTIRIKSYIKDGRLVIPEGSAVFINCEACGEQIRFGKICRQCADKLSGEMKAALQVNDYNIGDKPSTGNGKMKFLDSNRI
jgi:hypothetical protein